MSGEEALQLGDHYIQMAKDMSVSSREIAQGAVEFWRQGLNVDEVDERMEAAIMYGKISGMEFTESAELITAAVNSMGVEASRVVDVWSYLGDASASGADELGRAAQKAAASAQQFGVSFEWLSSYIATLSERTRLAPEQIGTALNTMFARMYAIKKTGYNEEDDTNVNDVARALGEIDILLTDGAGNWRNYSDIILDVASVWGTLDDRTRSYIATTMAGTRQQNMFLNLMADMSQITEGNSRAIELYNGAMESAGSATEKYSIYQESVTAAQDRMKAALEELYNLLSADLLKTGYGMLTSLIEGFTGATEAIGGMNLVIPVAVAGISLIIATIGKFVSAYKAAEAITKTGKLFGMFGAVGASPIIVAITAITAALSLAGGAIAAFNSNAKYEARDFSEVTASLEKQESAIRSLRDEYQELIEKTDKTQAEQDRLAEITGIIQENYPALAASIESTTGGFENQTGVLKGLNAELEKYAKYQAEIEKQEAYDTLLSTDNLANWSEKINNALLLAYKMENLPGAAEVLMNYGITAEMAQNAIANNDYSEISKTLYLGNTGWLDEISEEF